MPVGLGVILLSLLIFSTFIEFVCLKMFAGFSVHGFMSPTNGYGSLLSLLFAIVELIQSV